MTKFSIGRFTNGAYTVCGVIIHKTLYGIILKTDYPSVHEKFSFIKLYDFNIETEFNAETDTLPHFRKLNVFKKIFNIFFNFIKGGRVSDTLEFLKEISNLPQCALKYKDILYEERRIVLIEKKSYNSIFKDYANLNSEKEFKLIELITKKYKNQKFINELYSGESKKQFHDNDPFSHNCTVQIPTFHGEKIFVHINTYTGMSSIYEIYINALHSINMKEKGFNILVNKINQ